jgi:hypothetical protein
MGGFFYRPSFFDVPASRISPVAPSGQQQRYTLSHIKQKAAPQKLVF